MSDRKWGLWLFTSVIWFLAHFFITIIAPDLEELGRNWFFLFGYILSVANLLFCVYVGSIPSESN